MSLRIAIVGYGKMGHAVEQEAQARGHQVVLRIDPAGPDSMTDLQPGCADCIIEFTQPQGALHNFEQMLQAGIPVVTGTTGWHASMQEVQAMVAARQGAFLHSSNFSVGVNVLFQLNKQLARLMNAYPEYDPYIEEAHHRHKKDAPSGTALSLAQQTLDELDRKSTWESAALQHRAPEPDELSVGYTRAGEIIGNHTVAYISDIDEIRISHQAFNRRGFALGAVIAAEWIQGKNGFFNFAQLFEQH